MKRRQRTTAVLAALAAGSLALIASTQTWFDVALTDSPDAVLSVSGADALPVLAPLSLAVLALAAALSIAGRVMVWIFGGLLVVLGGTLTALVWPIALTSPVSAVAVTVTEATGIAGRDAVADLVASIWATPWPPVALVASVVVVLVGVFVLATGRSWHLSGRKYRTDSGRAAVDEGTPLDSIDSWDDLSRGEDPTR